MKAFFAERNQIKADEIAIRQLVALNEYLGRRDKPLRVWGDFRVIAEVQFQDRAAFDPSVPPLTHWQI
jgi:hypothetical protein